MKEVFHICFSSTDEVIFRSIEDYRYASNCIAISSIVTETNILAWCLMSNHCHFIIEADKPRQYILNFRIRYGKYFNKKYLRQGRLGNKNSFFSILKGANHKLAAISYVLRNPVHHRICTIPYGYKYSSIHYYFMSDFGRESDLYKLNGSTSLTNQSKSDIGFLLRRANIKSLNSEQIYINSHGVISPISYMDISQVENLYRSSKCFTYYMTRMYSNIWDEEQKEDAKFFNVPIITLDVIENSPNTNMAHNIVEYMKVDKGKRNSFQYTDEAVCTLIDNKYLSRYNALSYTQLSKVQLFDLCEILKNRHMINIEQIKRCLAIKVDKIDGVDKKNIK